MNETATYLLKQHDGPAATVYAGKGFDHLTEATACTYLLDSDGRILTAIFETDADEPLDEVCDFFIQQMWLAKVPTDGMKKLGVRPMYGYLLVARLALDDVPEWQKTVIQDRINEALTVLYTKRETYEDP